MARLKNKVTVITGGADGLGWSMAKRFAEEGSKVVVLDVNWPPNHFSNDDELLVASGKIQGFCVDVKDGNAVEQAIELVEQQVGSVDILINNAGISRNIPFTKTSHDQLDLILKTDLYGAFFCAQSVSRRMITRGTGGVIVNISSVNALVGSEGRSAYAAAKGGLLALTRVLAVELARDNIRVNSIAPGAVHTAMLDSIWDDVKNYPDDVPMKRFGDPDEIANAAVFICSDEASFITGVTLPIDGGFSVAGKFSRGVPKN